MGIFRYFPDFPEGADLRDTPCILCDRRPAIPEIRLGFGRGLEGAVCATCIAEGKATVRVPSWVQSELEAGVTRTHPEWSDQEHVRYVSERVNELAHTPPVPWLQDNDWPVCDDDFAMYRGEVTRDRLEQRYGSVREAKARLREILLDAVPDWEQDDAAIEAEWNQLADWLAIFAFSCHNGTWIHIVQTA
jgi:uncharacterized protein CbrC (UPF0167 family)